MTVDANIVGKKSDLRNTRLFDHISVLKGYTHANKI